MRQVWQQLTALWTACFGAVHWDAPPWLGRVRGAVRHWWARPLAQRRRHVGMVLLPAAIVALAYGAWFWFGPTTQPQRKITVTVVNPQPPPPRQSIDPVPPPEPLDLNFSESAAPLERVDKSVTEGISMHPAMPGTWRWMGDKVLRFETKTPWPVGQAFTVRLAENAVAPQVRLVDDSVTVQVHPMEVNLDVPEFYQDPTDPKTKQVVATLHFPYPVNPNTLTSRVHMARIDANGKRKPLSSTITYDDLRFAAYVKSDVIAVGLEDEQGAVQVDAGVTALAGGRAAAQAAEKTVRIPGRYTMFHVQQTNITLVRNDQGEPEQVLMVEGNTGVLAKDMVAGLSAWLLPVDKPAVAGREAIKHMGWYGPEQVGPEVLAAGEVVHLQYIPGAQENSVLHSFKINVPPGRSLFVRVKKGTEAYGGYPLRDNHEAVLAVPQFPREVRVMHDGAVLSVSGDQRLSVLTRGVPAVRLTLWRIFPEALNHLISLTRGDFKDPHFLDYNFNERDIAEAFTDVRVLDSADPRKATYTTVDFSRYVDAGAATHHGMFLLQATGWDPKCQCAMRARAPRELEDGEGEGEENTAPSDDDPTDRRFVLVSDLGVLVKSENGGTSQAYVQSFRTGAPVSDATVEILGRNGVSMFARRTNADGMAPFPNLRDLREEKEPMAYVVRSGADLAFLPYDRYDRRLNLSRFDTGGMSTRYQQQALDAYLFSDRGMYRPGETVHLGVLVKPTDWRQKIAGVAVELSATDPRGMTVRTKRMVVPADGLLEWQLTTDDNAPTGSYGVAVHLIQHERPERLLGSTSLRVQEFLPDRLRIAAHMVNAPREGWLHPDQVAGEVRLSNLFGTPAVGHTVNASMLLVPSFPRFSGYPGYNFHDPQPVEHAAREPLGGCTTNDAGICGLKPDLQNYAQASYELRLQVTGMTLTGGRGVDTEASVLVSPRNFLLGVRSRDDLTFVKHGSPRQVDVLAVDPNLTQVRAAGLNAAWIERRYVSVLVRQSNSTYQYQSVLKDIVRKREPFTVEAKGTTLALPTDDVGTFVMSILDANDVELHRVEYNVAGEANLSRNLEHNAELQLALDKTDAAPGDTLTINIKAPYTGAGLITIERDRVYAHKWFKTTTTASTQTIEVPPGLEANGYVTVTFLRSLDSPEVFMSPLSYGVVPFSVSRAARTVKVELEVLQHVEPGHDLTMAYRTDQKAKVILFAVDEGILQVANYTTPDPLAYLMRKRALDVQTAQILDQLLPEFSVLQALSKEGGDDENEALRHNLNPFKRKHDKPVAFWSGIVEGGPETHTATMTLPETFNGSVRVMAVAVNEQALGVDAAHTQVRGQYILSPSAPLFATPGDVFDASVSVANESDKPGSDQVVVALETSDNLECVGDLTQALHVKLHGEQAVHFQVRTKAQPKGAELRFDVRRQGDKAALYKVHWPLSVRPASPYIVAFQAGALKDDDTTLPAARQLFAEHARREVMVSPLPVALADGVCTFLQKFPYLCTEQVLSKAAPSIALHSMAGVHRDEKQDAQTVQDAVQVLQSRQNEEGGFGYWEASSNAIEEVSVYAAQFLTEAREAGFVIPQKLHGQALDYLSTLVHGPASNLVQARVRAYALYMLARNGKLATRDVAALRQFLARDKSEAWKRDVIPLYLAGTYALMRDQVQADQMFGAARWPDAPVADLDNFYDEGVLAAQTIAILSRHFRQRLPTVQAGLLQHLIDHAAHMHTYSGALSLYALAAYTEALGDVDASPLKSLQARAVVGDKTVDLPVGPGVFPVLPLPLDATRVQLKSPASAPLFYALTDAGFDRAPPTTADKQGLEVYRTLESVVGTAVSNAALGDVVQVHVKVRATGAPVRRVALVDLLPGGFDLVLQDNGHVAQPESTWTPEYVDAREDRVVAYGDVPNHTVELVYRVKATAAGEFVMPPTYAEGMYARAMHGQSAASHVRVTGAP